MQMCGCEWGGGHKHDPGAEQSQSSFQELFSEQPLLQHPIISLLSGLHADGVAGEEEKENDN